MEARKPERPRNSMLGIDVGERRIGVALSEGRIAVPLTIVEHTNRAADIARIADLAHEHDAATIVVGVPLRADGGETEQSRLTRKFGEQLAHAVDAQVVYQDESYSSVAIAAVEAPVPRKRNASQKARIDDLAAAVILQSYIDAHEAAS
jgi:putative Holliday junction resolvase